MSRRVKVLDKATAQLLHGIKRANERYGLELTKTSYLSLCEKIIRGEGTWLGKQSNRLSVWRLEVLKAGLYDTSDDTVTCNVVYDRFRHRIVTFLPPSANDAWGVNLQNEIEEA